MLLRFPWKNVLPVKAGRGGLAEGEAPRVQHRKIFKIDVSEDCIIGKKSGLRRNPLGQHVRTFGDIFVKRYIKAIYL